MSRKLNEEQSLLSGDNYSELDCVLLINDEDNKNNLVEGKKNRSTINSENEALTDNKDGQNTPNANETPAYIRDFLDSQFFSSQEESVRLTGITLEYLDPTDYIDHPLRHQPEDEDEDEYEDGEREPLSSSFARASLASFSNGVFWGICAVLAYLKKGRFDSACIASLVSACLSCIGALLCQIKSRRFREEEELPSFTEAADTIYNFFRPVQLNRPHEENPIVATTAANQRYTPPTLGNLPL